MPGPSPALREAARRARFLSTTRYAWDGTACDHDPRRVLIVRGSEGYPSIVAEVAQRIYDQAYIRPDDPRAEHALVHDRGLRRAFAERLSAAAPRGPSADAEAQPGWWYLHGTQPLPRERAVRVYWNVCAPGAPVLVRAVAESLEAAGVPYRLKVLSDPQRFARADGGVLYLPAGAWPTAEAALAPARQRVAPWLRAAVPMFTLPLQPGVGFAEDPGQGESFGTHRARLVAEGLWRAHEEGLAGARAVGRVAQHFRAAGVDPEAPHRALAPAPGEPRLREALA